MGKEYSSCKENVKRRGHRDTRRIQRMIIVPLCVLCVRVSGFVSLCFTTAMF
jgi:hypothetical protein